MSISRTEVKAFTCGLYGLLSTGTSLVQCFNILAERQSNIEFKRIIEQISSDFSTGASLTLAGAFAKYPEIFDENYIGEIYEGEDFDGPSLVEALEYLCCGETAPKS